jgi:hypothetical protein
VALAGGTAGLLLGGMMASSKVDGLYERVERAEAANAVQSRLLDELSQVLRLLLDDLATSRDNSVNPQTRQVLERLALAAELRAHPGDPDSLSAHQP